MKRILDASLLWSVNVCLLIEVLHTPGIYNLAKWSLMAFCEATCSAFHNFLLWRWAHKAFHVYLHVCLLNLHVRYLDFQRLFFCYVQRVEAINRFYIYIYIYIGEISDRHCLNLVLDVTKLYEIYFSHAFWLWEQHTVLSFSPSRDPRLYN
jgi:hypothetical protein